MSALARLCSLQTLTLDGTEVTEGSLELLASHQALSSLSLGGIPVASGDEALRIVSGVDPEPFQMGKYWKFCLRLNSCVPGLRLTQLTLPGRHSVTDSGLAFLSRLALLSGLDLTDYTQVTDRGVSQLSCMTRSATSHFGLSHFRLDGFTPGLQVRARDNPGSLACI